MSAELLEPVWAGRPPAAAGKDLLLESGAGGAGGWLRLEEVAAAGAG